MNGATYPHRFWCEGSSTLCQRCRIPLVLDPTTGAWCRTCRTAHQAAAPGRRCTERAEFTGLLGPYRGTRLYPGHAADTTALLGPHAVRHDR